MGEHDDTKGDKQYLDFSRFSFHLRFLMIFPRLDLNLLAFEPLRIDIVSESSGDVDRNDRVDRSKYEDLVL